MLDLLGYARLLPDHGADLRHHLPRPQRAVGPDRPVQCRRRRLRRDRRLCLGAADHAGRRRTASAASTCRSPLGWLGATLAAGIVRAPRSARSRSGCAPTISRSPPSASPSPCSSSRSTLQSADRRAVRHRLHPAARSPRWPATRCCSTSLNLGARRAVVVVPSISRSSGWSRSPWGRVLRAHPRGRGGGARARQERRRASACRPSPSAARIMGLAGAVQAHFIGFIAPGQLSADRSPSRSGRC